MNSNEARWRERGIMWAGALVPWVAFVVGYWILARIFRPIEVAQDFVGAPGRMRADALGELWLLVLGACGAGLIAALPTRGRVGAQGACAVVGVALATALGFAGVKALWVMAGVPVAIVVMAFLPEQVWGGRLARFRYGARPGLVGMAVLALVVSLAAERRLEILPGYLLQELEGDATGYVGISHMGLTYGTLFREPGFPWVLSVGGRMAGVAKLDQPAAHMVSIALSLLGIVAVFEFCRRWFCLTTALVAGLLYAATSFMAWGGVRVLREDVMNAAFFGFAAVAIMLWGKRPTWRGYAALGALGTVNIFLRLNSHLSITAIILMVFAWGAWRHRVGPRGWAPLVVAFAVMWLPIVPFLVFSQRQNKDAFYTVNMHTRFYRNLERAEKGIIPYQEFLKDPHGGPKVGMVKYLFGEHSVGEVVNGTARGAWRLFFGDLVQDAGLRGPWDRRGNLPVVYPLHVLGLAAFFLSGRRRLLGVMLLLFLAPGFFIMNLKGTEPRVAALGFVGFYVGCGLAVATLAAWGRRVFGTGLGEGDGDQVERLASASERRLAARKGQQPGRQGAPGAGKSASAGASGRGRRRN